MGVGGYSLVGRLGDCGAILEEVLKFWALDGGDV